MRGVTIVKAAGHSMSKDFLALALDKYPACWGIAAPFKEGPLARAATARKLSVDDLFGITEKYKERTMLLHLGQHGEGESGHEDDFQPFVLLENSDGKPIVVAVLDGDFSDFYHKESSHSPEFFCVNEDLIPRIKQIYNYVNGDLAAFVAELSEKRHTRDLINLMVGDQGTITIYTAGYEPMCFTIGDGTRQYDWGWVSDTLGFESGNPVEEIEDELAQLVNGAPNAAVVPSKPVVKDTVGPSVPSGGASTSVPATGHARRPARPGASHSGPAPAPVVASTQPVVGSGKSNPPAPSATSGKADPASTNGSGVAAQAIKPDDKLTINVPTHLLSDAKRLYQFFKNRMDPDSFKMINKDNLKGIKTITMVASKASKQFLQSYLEQNGMSSLTAIPLVTNGGAPHKIADALPNDKKPQMATGNQGKRPERPGQQKPVNVGEYPDKTAAATAEPVKDVAPAHVSPASKAVIGSPIPIIPPSEKGKVLTFLKSAQVKEMTDRQFQLISDPTKFHEMEQRIASAPEQLPVPEILSSMEDMYKWPYEMLLNLAKLDNPTTMATLCYNLILHSMKLNHELEQLTAPSQPQTEVIPEPAKVQAVAGAGGRRPTRPGRLPM